MSGLSQPAIIENSTAPLTPEEQAKRDAAIARRAVVLMQAAAHSSMEKALKEEARLLAEEAGLTERRGKS